MRLAAYGLFTKTETARRSRAFLTAVKSVDQPQDKSLHPIDTYSDDALEPALSGKSRTGLRL